MHNYPQDTGYQSQSRTSREAARSFTGKSDIYGAVLDILELRGIEGATVDEAVDRMSYKGDRSTVAARFTELHAKDKIYKTKITRRNGKRKNVSVYIMPKVYDPDFHKGIIKPRKVKYERKDMQDFIDVVEQQILDFSNEKNKTVTQCFFSIYDSFLKLKDKS